ncbi:hypothetical protein KM043_008191 [Ampulex compressa]|nr:hypothetical protein KM043_008191 [Ampulex compressa]
MGIKRVTHGSAAWKALNEMAPSVLWTSGEIPPPQIHPEELSAVFFPLSFSWYRFTAIDPYIAVRAKPILDVQKSLVLDERVGTTRSHSKIDGRAEKIKREFGIKSIRWPF